MKARSAKVPRFIALRRWWLLPLAFWAMTVAASLYLQLAEQRQHGLDVATEGARNMFEMVVLMRAWNAGHGGVYVPVTDKTRPNPYLEHPRRDLTTTDGQALTMINPAFMTRQLAEMALKKDGARFHITSLRPIRPQNAADPWETEALQAFERGEKERMALLESTGQGPWLRYMAPLKVTPPCLACHARQGYHAGEIRGGISVSLPYSLFEMHIQPAMKQAYASHAMVFILVIVIGWLLLELLRIRWLELASHIDALDSARASLEQARDQAEAANRAKSALLANVSHELRTPMNGILGMAELLRSTHLDATQRDYLVSMQKSGNQLMKLLGAIIDFARIDETRKDATISQSFLPARLLVSVVSRHASHAATKELDLRTEVGAHADTTLIGDAEQLENILDRLVDNAIKFTESGSVRISVQVEPVDETHRRLTFKVSDTGMGIAPEMQARLFQPFEVADNTITRHHGGLGLGLALCKKLADRLGATLGVRSTPGEGSTFSLELVLEAAPVTTRPLTESSIMTFIELLNQQDIRASTLFAELSRDLRRHLGPAYAELERYMNEYRYTEARELLRLHSDLS
jgi:signal transduction histidine kinase